MKNRMYVAVVVFAVLMSKTVCADSLRCLGSDGGTPFSNITADISTKQTVVKSSGLIRDFVYHESLNQIVYQNVRHQLRVLHLDSLCDHFLNHMRGKLSRIVEDAKGRVLSAYSTHYLDTRESLTWRGYSYGSKVTQQLFSENGNIFSVESILNQKVGLLKSNKYLFTFATLEQGQPGRRICHIPPGFGSNLTLAQGNLFPYIHFYTMKKGVVEDKIMVYRMAVNRVGSGGACPVEEVTQYPAAQLGTIKAFYYLNLDSVDAYAFHLADPKRNLFLDKPGECAYYNFNGRTPIFISPKQGVFGSWKNGEGLGLHNLKEKTEVRLFQKVSQPQFGAENLWLSEDGKTLYSALSTHHDQGGKLIIKTDLKNF